MTKETKNTTNDANQNKERDQTDLIDDKENTTEAKKILQEEHKKEKERWMLALASSQNKIKALEREKDNLRKFLNTQLLKEIVEINENLLKALSSIDEGKLDTSSETSHLYKGVAMIQVGLESILKSQGVSRILPEENSKFDPTFHQAMSVVESDKHEDDKIISCTRAGYTLHERVLSPALVIVSKKKT